MRGLVIAGRELRLLFVSPLAWVVLAVVHFLLAYIFLTRLDLFMQHQARIAALENAPGITQTVIAPMLGSAGFIMLLVVPMLTMRTFSEERRSGSLILLLASPATLTEVVLGKYLGLLGFFSVMLALTAAMPLSLALGANIDMGQFLTCILALMLVLSTISAIGMFLSSLTEHPPVAAISTFGVLLTLWIIDWASTATEEAGTVLGYLSLMRHFEPLLLGLVNSVDLAYFALVTGLFLALTIWRLDTDRLYR